MHADAENAAAVGLIADVLAAREATMRLVAPLELEDWVVQSMPDASPVKWHLAHTTWFFERFVLRALGISPVVAQYEYLFNSYYDSVGARHPRSRRGMLTRPTAREVVAYRKAVDERIADLASSPRLFEIAPALELGKNHEQQHQELLLTDVKHLLAQNPLLPRYRADATTVPRSGERHVLAWRHFDGGIRSMGNEETTFAFDNERPRHRVYVEPFGIASRLVTSAEYAAFIDDGGYRRPELWLSEGWSWVQATHATAPLYWDQSTVFTLDGKRERHSDEPVCHVTYYEADAYARWAGARLPREAEWEIAAAHSKTGTFLDDGALHPQPAASGSALGQMLGDVWEWTASAYSPYPGFVPLPGAFGEYNGKFMVNQIVLRGGSCVTPRDHIRTTYRNFFPAGAAWQFSGIRLARDEA